MNNKAIEREKRQYPKANSQEHLGHCLRFSKKESLNSLSDSELMTELQLIFCKVKNGNLTI